MNIVVSTFAAEQIEVEAGGLKIWNTLDPYHNASIDISASLESFRVAMDVMTPTYDGDIAHLLSTELFGGLAYVGILDVPSYAVGVTGYIDNYATNAPLYGWNAEALCHELGHNIASPHTQSCSWPLGPIDNCVAPEYSCAPGPPPIGGGTIMSYCQFINTPYTTLLANGFGPLPGAKIRAGIANSTSLQTTSPPNDPIIIGNEPICFPNSLTLTASCTSGTTKWLYDAAGTILIHSGASYTTGNLNANTTIYAVCDLNSCQSSLVSISITGTSVPPSPPPAKTTNFCSTQNYTLTADGCVGGTINWYTSSAGDIPIFVGNPLLVQKPPFGNLVSKNYYASCQIGGCESTRTLQRAQKVTIVIPPTNQFKTIISGSSTILKELLCNYTVKWYSDPVLLTLVHTGDIFQTPVLNNTTTYYLRCEASDQCKSLPAEAIVNVTACPPILNLSSPTDDIASGTYRLEVSDNINSTAVLSGGNVEYDAGSFIMLEPGFLVSGGAVFNAYIDGCGGN